MSEEQIEKVKAETSEVAQKAESRIRDQLEFQKEETADRAEELSRGLNRAAEAAGNENGDTLGQYASSLASTMNSFAEKLRTRSIDDVIRETAAIARRDPGLFLAGSVALGFAMSRFFKASSRPEENETDMHTESDGGQRSPVTEPNPAEGLTVPDQPSAKEEDSHE